MIEIKNLTKKYENATPLSDVSTTVNKGDVIAVIGPSGTGKSTFLRCINRLEEPTGGEIIIDGESITDPKCNLKKIRRKIGMVFQSFNLYTHLTVVENCMLAQTVLLKKTAQEAYDKAMKTLRSVGMEKCALQYPDQLSGGQKQRAAIARTLCTDPEILLFDEPTSALDPIMVAEVEDVIENLAKQGCTMMIVTHSMDFARRIANRVFYMDQGGIYEDGPAEEVFEHPKRELTKKFIRYHSCLEFVVTPEKHNPEEEFGRIYKFGQSNSLSPERTLKVLSCYEEMSSLLLQKVFPSTLSFSALFEYDKAEDTVRVAFSGFSSAEADITSSEVTDTLEYKILSHSIKKIETVCSEETGYDRYLIEL